ncbi:MAG: hypothetical protein IJJ80_03110 [Clostridia bacterium]|nr:hypothetical protein [Clostridia bacterium]
MKQKPKASEPLRRVRHARALMRLAQFMALALFGVAVYCFYIRDYREGWALVAASFLAVVLLALPAANAWRRQWKRQSIIAGYGTYAEQTELDERPHMAPEQFELLCLFPFDFNATGDFDVHREIRLTCRERTVSLTEMTVPARIRGLEALVDGVLIRMDMPRAPVSRLMLTGTSFGDLDILTAWYRKNLRLLPAMFSVQQQMQAFSDGSEPGLRTISQLHRITEKRARNIVLSLAGRELNVFIRNAVILTNPPMGFGQITQQRLEQLGIPELPAILDFAFDTEALRAGADIPFDEEEDRKQAGLQTVIHEADEDFRRPEEHE